LGGLTVSVQTHDRREDTELEPADQQFMEIRIVDASAVESADVGREPGNAGDPHVHAGDDLRAKIVEGRSDIS